MTKQLYVGNLSWDTDDSALRAAFSPYGEIGEVKLVMDRDTGRSRGFAFVTMNQEQEANAAIQGLNGTMLQGRELRVNVAEERRPRNNW